MTTKREVFICDGIRTPIGRYGGALALVRPDDLAATVIRNLLARNSSVDPVAIDEVILGCANQAGEDNRNVARMSALIAGLPPSVPGVTVNRLCASGLQAIGDASRAIAAGEADLIIAGGTESMTRAPFVMSKGRRDWARDIEMHDTTMSWRFINRTLQQMYGTDSMPETAENVADAYKISREDQDRYALQSQHRAALAQQSGFFSEEIMPITVKHMRTEKSVTSDEHPRPETTLKQLHGLRPVAKVDGSVTAGNASGINDGAAAVLIAAQSAVTRFNLTPRARIVGMASAGVEPRVMGIGPVPATQKLLSRIGWTLDDLDTIEVNEAFAAQAVAVVRTLGLSENDERINPNGGAIALGHPLGMTGTRLALTLTRQLEASQGKRGLVSLCVGVGQGLSLALERV